MNRETGKVNNLFSVRSSENKKNVTIKNTKKLEIYLKYQTDKLRAYISIEYVDLNLETMLLVNIISSISYLR